MLLKLKLQNDRSLLIFNYLLPDFGPSITAIANFISRKRFSQYPQYYFKWTQYSYNYLTISFISLTYSNRKRNNTTSYQRNLKITAAKFA